MTLEEQDEETSNFFLEVYGIQPHCGLFPVMDDYGIPHYAISFQLEYSDSRGVREYKTSVEFSLSKSTSSDIVDVSKNLQVVIDIKRDSNSYHAQPFLLTGAIIICNYNGEDEWDGPQGTNPMRNIFPIPSKKNPGSFTNASWYYVDDYAIHDEYQAHTLKHIGVTLLDITSAIGGDLQNFFNGNVSKSPCCSEMGSLDAIRDYVINNALPRHTPKLILEKMSSALDLSEFTSIDGDHEIYAPAHSRYQGDKPGFDTIFNGKILDLRSIDNVVAPFHSYNLFLGDLAATPTATSEDFLRTPQTPSYPPKYSLRRYAIAEDNQPHFSKNIPIDELQIDIIATVLISDKVLTKRNLRNETFTESSSCVHPFGRRLS